MMKFTLKIFGIFLLLSLVIIKPTPSYAWHRHSYIGVNFGVWPRSYYYDDPYYPYYYAEPYYSQPIYVSTPSSSYQPIIVNGVTYYLNNGVYYLYTQYGYQAVATPSGITVPVIQAASETSASVTRDDSFMVNIPNGKGGFTAVLLKKSGKGFTGPQGEFYSEFPKVSQLQVMYGK